MEINSNFTYRVHRLSKQNFALNFGLIRLENCGGILFWEGVAHDLPKQKPKFCSSDALSCENQKYSISND